MRRQKVNGVAGMALIVLSLTALLAVLSGYFQPPQTDEGAAAHPSAVDRSAGADDLAFPCHGGLETAFAKHASVAGFGRGFASCLPSLVLP
jgi:hypothetical protein